MFTSHEIRQEHVLSTRRMRSNDSRRRASCIPLTLMAESIRSFQSGNVPDQKRIIDESRTGDVIRRRSA